MYFNENTSISVYRKSLNIFYQNIIRLCLLYKFDNYIKFLFDLCYYFMVK